MLKAILAAAVVATTVVLAGTASAAGDQFTGAWSATDPFDGSSLRLEIGAPSPSGVRHVTLMDTFASACGAPATAIGTGTVSGSTLTTVVDIRCGGELRGEDVTITYQLVGSALTDGFSTFTRAADAFTGAWSATDPFDGSSLRLEIGAPSPSGVRHVTLTDTFASACGAPATAIGTGTVSGSTLTTVVDIRCGGVLRGKDVTITYTLVGDKLTDGFSTFTR